MNSMQLTRKEASTMTISSLKESLTGDRIESLSAMQKELRDLTQELHQLNSTNRVLAHRARTSIQELMSIFNSDGVRVCNVTV
jgi:flagellar biosynthesis/type III secretory pathway chaperone